ncbi:MAG: ribosome silencing factor [Candidatus Marinimicrobia bacterium]|jgi:ribosome-associated protein|nr:ribosome silencing factor [Candidatus Neomarinimicrobiota bacterium]MBT4360592.1 ribosome silencing factor [Candidatus Neomarinimicrobiota bacterium]MBT4715457.1 ribosome silencing factor [Candidatus Neomarinimicrobiota bacterium]MBT4946384.1 ribosome silencing factor [Candidatus Neomarinimicrobiota bacterium]MBT5268845.1 ribosome silencing factor [Candidatus Neomarinimicrobiota bacterium]
MPDNYSDSKQLAFKIGELALQKKANRVKILDVHKITSMTDFFVICSGNSDVQVKAIIDHIEDEIAEVERPFNKEGYDTREWVLLDYINVVVHVFHEASRDFYDLERLWIDAEITELSEDENAPNADTPLFDNL